MLKPFIVVVALVASFLAGAALSNPVVTLWVPTEWGRTDDGKIVPGLILSRDSYTAYGSLNACLAVAPSRHCEPVFGQRK